MAITYKETVYDISIEGTDICLQSPTHDIIIVDGYESLKDECIEEVRFPVSDGENIEWEWDGDQVQTMVYERLNEYALAHASDGDIVYHEN
jgi:hypothetical protein